MESYTSWSDILSSLLCNCRSNDNTESVGDFVSNFSYDDSLVLVDNQKLRRQPSVGLQRLREGPDPSLRLAFQLMDQARCREDKRRARQEEKERRRQLLDKFFKDYGFRRGVNGPQTRTIWAFCRQITTYPLHRAAALGDAYLVEMLLREGAEVALKDSKGKTAVEVAEMKNKDGSHNDALRWLEAAAHSWAQQPFR